MCVARGQPVALLGCRRRSVRASSSGAVSSSSGVAVSDQGHREPLERVPDGEQLVEVPVRVRRDPDPLRGRCSTSPCSASSRRASRSGARLIWNRWVSCSSTSRSPGSSAPDRISARSLVVTSSTRLRGCNTSLDQRVRKLRLTAVGHAVPGHAGSMPQGRPDLPVDPENEHLQSRRRTASPTRTGARSASFAGKPGFRASATSLRYRAGRTPLWIVAVQAGATSMYSRRP